MKIGDFARKFGVNVTTVRYYVEHALLMPERRNNQFVFNSACEEDMENILKYKSMGFSIEEIELLLFLEKTSKFRDEPVLGIVANILRTKKAELERKEQEIRRTIEELTEEIEVFSTIEAEYAEDPNGIPFTFIPYLYCPECGAPLALESASISNNKLISGELSCVCGYEAEIDDGVVICEGYSESTPFRAFENIESVASIAEEFGNEYRMLLDRTYMWMYHQIPEDMDHGKVMVGPFTYNFLLKYCQEFSSDTTFIIIDPSLKRIKKMQQYMKEFDFQTVFIAGSMENIPLRKESVDVYIDDFSTTNCIFTYNRSHYGYIAPLIKKRGVAVGIFTDYRKAAKSISNFREDHPDFIPEKMALANIKADLRESGMRFVESKVTGETSGKSIQFRRQAENEKVPVLGYIAVK